MDESVRALDYSETTLKRDLPVVLAALRKPVESSYRCGDFKDHLCFIPQRFCTASDVSSRNAPSLVGGRESCEKVCEQKVPLEQEGDMPTFDSPAKFRISDERSKAAEIGHPTRTSRIAAAREARAEQLHAEYTSITGVFSSVAPSEVSGQTTAESGRGGSDDASPSLRVTAVQHRGSPHVLGEDRPESDDRAKYHRHRNTHQGLDDFIPCLFYRWPLSDTLIVHFHGFDEDLGKTSSYLERLHQQLEVNVLTMEYPGYGICRRLPRDQDGDTNELLRKRGTRTSFLDESVSSHQSEDFTREPPQRTLLPQQGRLSSVVESSQGVGGKPASTPRESASTSCHTSTCNFEEESFPSVRRSSPSIGADSATEGASTQIDLSSSTDYPRIATSCSRLILFVLQRLAVAPQCIYLSASKLAAGLVIECCLWMVVMPKCQLPAVELKYCQRLLVATQKLLADYPVVSSGRDYHSSGGRCVYHLLHSFCMLEALSLHLQLCRFTEDLLGSGMTLGGLILLQPLFIFPCSPPGTSDPASVKQRGKTALPREPVLDFEGSQAQRGLENFGAAQQTESIRTEILLDNKDQPAAAEEPDMSNVQAADFVPARRFRGRLESSAGTKDTGDSYHLAKIAGAPPVLEELCTTSSLDTSAEVSEECKQERDQPGTVTQAERSAAEDQLVPLQMKKNARVFQFAAGASITDSGQVLPFTTPFHNPPPDHNRSPELKHSELSARLLVSGGDSPVAKSGPAYAGDATHGTPGMQTTTGRSVPATHSTPYNQSVMANSTAVPASAVPSSERQTPDAHTTCNFPVPPATPIRSDPLTASVSSASAGIKYFQSLMKSSSVDVHSKSDNNGFSVSADLLTSSTSSHLCGGLTHSGQTSNPQVDEAAGNVCATSTEEEGNEISFGSRPFDEPLNKSDSASVAKELSLHTPARSFFAQIRGFFLPSFTLVPQSEPEEGGRTAAIAQAALQASRRKRLERLRRTAAALEGAFGMKQALRRVSAIRCPILFLAHRAAEWSHSTRARTDLCHSPDTNSETDIATNRTSMSSSSSESDTSALVSNADVTDTSVITLGQGGNFPAEQRVTQKRDGESVTADSSSICTSTAGDNLEPCFTGMEESRSREQDMQQTESSRRQGGAQGVEEVEDETKMIVGAKDVLAGGCSDLGQQRSKRRQSEGTVGKIQGECKISDRQSSFFLQDESSGTRSVAGERHRHRCLERAGQKHAESMGDRIAEDIVVDRSIGLLMAHAGNPSHNEVLTTFQLDSEFFTRVRAFLQRCKQTQRHRQELQQLAALRAPIILNVAKLADNCRRIEDSVHEKSRTRRRKKTVKKAFSPTRFSEFAKSGSRIGHTGDDKTVCIPLELFRIPPPYKDREEELIRAHARERLDDDDDRENFIPEESWLHK